MQDLNVIHDVYEIPLHHEIKGKTCFVDEAEIKVIFGNYMHIMKIHSDFCNSIKKGISDTRLSQLISREFLKTSNQFYLYLEYCSSYDQSLHLLHKLFSERNGLEDYILYLSRDPRAHGLDLFSYLIKPIQVFKLWCIYARESVSIRFSLTDYCRRWRRIIRSVV